MNMPRRLTGTLVGLLLLVACGADAPSMVDLHSEYGGSREVYEDIAAETDCDELQETFDRAEANNERAADNGEREEQRWTLGYMTAAEARMQEVGCHE